MTMAQPVMQSPSYAKLNKTANWETAQYAALIDKILKHGEIRDTRAGQAYSIFGEMLTIDMYDTFPLLRGRRLFYSPVLGELAAFLKGPKTIQDFKDMGCNYWDKWGNLDGADKTKKVGEINVDYGNAWLDFNGVNQLEELITKLKTNPTDRRLLISGWRPDNLPNLSLPCCHLLYQWYVRDGKFLDMVWYQRSVDVMVGLPSDIILACAWTALLANETNLVPGTIKFMLGDTHIYSNHLQPTLEYLRQLEKVSYRVPATYTLVNADIRDFTPKQLQINNYHHEAAVKFELNV